MDGPPPDLLLAEGVPLNHVPPPPPPAPPAAEKPKKKKEKEAPVETFEDEMEDVSESEVEEALDAEERAELMEKKVRKTLCFAVLSACGIICLIQLISRLCEKFSSAEYTGEDEIVNAAGNAAPVPPPPAGVEAAVAQNMAVAASQGAAASTAAGTTTAATVAATAASTAAVTSVTSTASVVGVSAVAVTGVGMATGVVPYPWGSHHPCHVFLDELVNHPGRVNLHLKNLPPNFFNVRGNTPLIESAFTEAYNKVLGSCVAHSIEGHNDTLLNSTDRKSVV